MLDIDISGWIQEHIFDGVFDSGSYSHWICKTWEQWCIEYVRGEMVEVVVALVISPTPQFTNIPFSSGGGVRGGGYVGGEVVVEVVVSLILEIKD